MNLFSNPQVFRQLSQTTFLRTAATDVEPGIGNPLADPFGRVQENVKALARNQPAAISNDKGILGHSQSTPRRALEFLHLPSVS